MTMTLKEFTEKFAPLPDARNGNNQTFWRKVFPTNLRWRTFETKPASVNIFSGCHPAKEDKVLEEEWERIHKGEVIDLEWRKVYIY